MTKRYAIYFTPKADNALYRLASSWLGYDAYSGDKGDYTHPQLEHCRQRFNGCTQEPAQYGFHATLKAPFRLHQDYSKKQLIKAMERFAKCTPAFNCSSLKLKKIGRFLALAPERPCEHLDMLAAHCVMNFEPYRAPLKRKEYLRRNPQQLTQPQLANLEQWGYPYVLDEFRFHMTLSGKLPEQQLLELREQLNPVFAPLLRKPLKIRHIHLFRQDRKNLPFRIISTHRLAQK